MRRSIKSLLFNPNARRIRDRSESPQEIIPGVFLGGYEDAENIDTLRRRNIGAVLNVAHFDNHIKSLLHLYLPHIRYMGLTIEDDPSFPIQYFFRQTNAFIYGARSQGLNVLVHCQAGISRSVTVLIAFLMSAIGWPLGKSLQRIRELRPEANPNPGFMSALARYERQL
jgi:protein-tyrosine phosphatase